MLSLGHFISFSFATEEVKGVNYFPSRANDQFEKRCYTCEACLHVKKFENKCKKKHEAQKLSNVQTCTIDLAPYSPTQWQFWQLTLKWFSGARAQDKNNQYYSCFFFFFFSDFYSIMRFRENPLPDSWIPRYIALEKRYCTHRFAIRAISVFACNLTCNSLVK